MGKGKIKNQIRTLRFLQGEMTQEELANRLSVAQSNISRLEHRRDMLISTLQEVVRALGGELRLSAVFPDGVVEINQFLAESSSG